MTVLSCFWYVWACGTAPSDLIHDIFSPALLRTEYERMRENRISARRAAAGPVAARAVRRLAEPVHTAHGAAGQRAADGDQRGRRAERPRKAISPNRAENASRGRAA